jgi:hypothetical protein
MDAIGPPVHTLAVHIPDMNRAIWLPIPQMDLVALFNCGKPSHQSEGCR